MLREGIQPVAVQRVAPVDDCGDLRVRDEHFAVEQVAVDDVALAG